MTVVYFILFYRYHLYGNDGFLGTILEKRFIYYDPSNLPSFSGSDKLSRFVWKDGKIFFRKNKIKKCLQRQ